MRGLPFAGPVSKDLHERRCGRVLAALRCHRRFVNGVALERGREWSRDCGTFGNFGEVIEANLDLAFGHHLAAWSEPRDLELRLDLLDDAELVDGGSRD